MTLYQVHTLPVSINHTSRHATQLLNHEAYLAIDTTQQYYTTLSSQYLALCTGRKHK